MKQNGLFLIGLAKSGSTSLYSYLTHDNRVCKGITKELNFFTSNNHPLYNEKSNMYHSTKEDYLKLFNNPDSPYFLDASVNYYRSDESIKKILDFFPKAKFIILYRKPSDRILSWYRFAKQTGKLNLDSSFEDFLKVQLQTTQKDSFAYQYAKDENDYPKRLLQILKLVPSENLFIGQFEYMVNKPKEFCEEIFNFLSLETTSLEINSIPFQIHNKTYDSNSIFLKPLLKINLWITNSWIEKIWVFKVVLKFIRNIFKHLFFKNDSSKNDSHKFREDDREKANLISKIIRDNKLSSKFQIQYWS